MTNIKGRGVLRIGWLAASRRWSNVATLASPYLLSSALSWATTWGCTVATWSPPPTPPPLLAPLRRGCSASAAEDRSWGSGWAGPPASRGGSGGWKVGEVSCGCFLITVPALRGVGSGCLLTVLGRGERGRGERVQEGKPHAIRQNEGAKEWDRKTARAETDRERWCGRQKETPLPEFNETSAGRTQ